MNLISYVLLITLVFCLKEIVQDKPVVIYVHGINDNCPIDSFERHLNDFDFECIYLNRGDFGTLRSQANKGCSLLKPHDQKLKKGFTLVGFSQGGLLARIILQTCEYGQYVKRFISIAGPQNGVAYTPFTNKNFFINWIAFMLCDKFLFRLFVVPCNYLKFIHHLRAYENSQFQLLDFNNELTVNKAYKNRIENLDFFVNLSFLEDQVVTPYNSGNFGYYDDSGQNFIDFKQTIQYKENRLGLKTLNDSGKFFRCEGHGAHVIVSEEQYKNLIVPFLNYRTSDYEQHWDYINSHCVYNQFEWKIYIFFIGIFC